MDLLGEVSDQKMQKMWSTFRKDKFLFVFLPTRSTEETAEQSELIIHCRFRGYSWELLRLGVQ